MDFKLKVLFPTIIVLLITGYWYMMSSNVSDTDIFIAIHLEVGPNPSATIYQEGIWPHLVELVQSADQYDHKLNLLFNPQWASYLVENPAKLQIVRSWEENGHLLGLHHHGAHHHGWNGYTDQAEYRDEPRYIGTVDEMMALIKKLTAGGQVLVTCMSDDDAAVEFPEGILYDVDGGADGVGDLSSTPASVAINGHRVTQLRHAKFGGLSEIDVSIEEVEYALKTLGEDEVIGIVFHGFDYRDRPMVYDNLFKRLDVLGVHTEIVPDIVG